MTPEMAVSVYNAVNRKYGHDRAADVVETMLTHPRTDLENPVAWGMKLARWSNSARRQRRLQQLDMASALDIVDASPQPLDQLAARDTLTYLIKKDHSVVATLLRDAFGVSTLQRRKRYLLRERLRSLLRKRESNGRARLCSL